MIRHRTLGLLGLFSALAGCGEDPSGGEGPVPMPGPGEVALSVSKTGAGSGVVVSTPAGIECGERCSAVFPEGTQVQLRATPGEGSFLQGWSGACSGTDICDLSLSTSQSVVARFEVLPPQVTLTVKRAGPSPGRIVSEPPGIDCGTTCSAQFRGGTKVRLRLLGDAATYLVGWTGACSGSDRCDLDMTEDRSVDALFHPRLCLSQNFCWDNPYPQGNSLEAVFGFGPDDVWAVGAAGVVMRWNGVGWLVQSSGIKDRFLSLWGTGPNDLWATGENGPVYRYDGTRWTTSMTLVGDLLVPALWGTAPNNVWVAGRRGRAYRFNGSSWTTYQTPQTSTLQSIWGPDAQNFWAVGSDGYIVRYSNGSFTQERFDPATYLRSVWGASAEDIWAVGDRGVVLRRTGGAWRPVNNVAGNKDLNRVFGTAADDVWIVGSGQAAYHFDGTSWRSTPVGVERLTGVWGAKGGDHWAVGAGGALARYRGDKWAVLSDALPGDLRAAVGFAEDDIWAVGTNGTVARYDGYRWRPIASGTLKALHAIWASGPSDIWVAGEAGTVLRYDGTKFNVVPGAPASADLKGISGSGPDDVWVVGTEGILHGSGAGLTAFDPMLRVSLSHVVSVGRGEMWAGEGLLVHAKNGGRTLRNVPRVVVGMWGTGPNDVWVGYEDGSFQRFDGTTWLMPQSLVLLKAARFWASAPNDIWALGEFGLHARWNGTTSILYNNGLTMSFAGVWGRGPASTWLLGLNGNIVRFKQ